MKIIQISVYQKDLSITSGAYRMAMGKVVSNLKTIVIRVDTDSGLSGYGEACPLGSNYLPAYAAGVVPGIKEIAPYLLDQNPLNIGNINALMDRYLKGHEYVKSPLDVACWDLMGKQAHLPLCYLLGGQFQSKLPMYFSISCGEIDEMVDAVQKARALGYKQFQIKLAGEVEQDIARVHTVYQTRESGDIFIADANQGFTRHQAMRFVRALQDIDICIEQPCETLDSCHAVRQHTNHAFKLDESVFNSDSLLDALNKQALDVACIKISKMGGLTKAKLARDLCATQGISMTVEDSWGSDIVTAALAHLAASTPVATMLNTTNLNAYIKEQIASEAPVAKDGYLHVPDKPGLGVEPDWSLLGTPVFVAHA